jgi:formylglycine-generating enzyme
MARGTRTYLRACVLLFLFGGCADVLGLATAAPIPGTCVTDKNCPPDFTCSNSQCKSNTCATPRQKQCNGLELLSCGTNGKWESNPQKCASGCENGECVGAPSCEVMDQCAGVSCCDSIQVGQEHFQLDFEVPEQLGDKLKYRPRSVSRSIRPFALDRFEVTVGRFNVFVAHYENARTPQPGAGKHPAFAESGWQESWNEPGGPLPQNIGDLTKSLLARGERLPTDGDQKLPVRGVSWYLAMAFCIWDGGRLPTEAEWVFAASGGDDREFPWGADADPSITPDRAVYTGDGVAPEGPFAVGEHPSGQGPLGHEDLAGNVQEWVADVYANTLPSTCHGASDATLDEFECLQRGTEGADRVLRGGAYENPAHLLSNLRRGSKAPQEAERDFGIRCARDLPAMSGR